MTPNFEERKKEFLDAYGKLVEEHKVDFMTTPTYFPAHKGDASWQLVMHTELVDVTNSPTPSPFQ